MLFNSLEYLIFLPIVFLLYWGVGSERLQHQNLLVVIASYLFYGWWDYRFLLLIFVTTLTTFFSGVWMEDVEDRQKRKRLAAVNVIFNLAILGIFKYFNFFSETFSQMLSLFGLHVDAVTLRLILPVGISFYTFQAIGYTLDVYRYRVEPTHHFIAFSAYISFFPQLVAGPIERASHLLPQMEHRRTFDLASAVDGLRQILWGLFKKMVVADNCALAVDEIFAHYGSQSSVSLLVGAFLFTMQIYGDFSGYSDIAVGTAKLFGISLMQNFRMPYFSQGIQDFWRRWHISLMVWLRDYVYIPLGGSRCSRRRHLFNIFVVFLLSGLWHGAAWTFILWGMWHGFWMMLAAVGGKQSSASAVRIRGFFGWACTFVIVMLGWIIFRAETMGQMVGYFSQMFSLALDADALSLRWGKMALLYSFLMLIAEWWQRDKDHALQLPKCGILAYRGCRWALYYIIIALAFCCYGTQQNFIYFQF